MAIKRDFTDRYLRSLKPAASGKRVVVYDAQVPNFGIRVSDHCNDENKGAFVLIARYPGSANPAPRRIGDYPAMTLAKARAIAREWREDIRQGIDPKVKEAERRLELERMRADTFRAAFETYAEEKLSKLRTGGAVAAAIKTHAFPKLANRPLKEIKRREVLSMLKEIAKKHPIAANRVSAYLKTFFVWALDEELIDDSPAASIKRLSKENERDRVLKDWEIRAIWRACGELGVFGRAFRFMLVTGQRRTEVGKMTWREIDRKQALWALEKERTKASRAHLVPLSPLALSILDDCPKMGDYVFSTGRSGRGKLAKDAKPVPISGWGKAKESLDDLALAKAQAIAVERGEDAPDAIAEWRLHDLRRSCASHLARLGVDRVVISKVLNHAEPGVTRIYDRFDRLGEKRAALDRWGVHLQATIDGTDGGNVVQLAARGQR
ncbi:MAG: tyrosine-type recombinase/integrase [Xanthobacteraceae bacterium]|nr:tyrosine-type recombinase/integrase [Xanthobacteraceae bacterium]